jgi:ribosomal protein L31E
MDPDPDADPSIFIIDLQDAKKKQIKKKSFSAYNFLKVLLHHHFSKIKSQKEVTKQ